MILGLIGCDCDELGDEFNYQGPYNDSLSNRLEEIFDDYDITEAVTGASRGAETPFSWICLSRGTCLTQIIPCSSFPTCWLHSDQDIYKNIIKCSNKVLVFAIGPITRPKIEYRDRKIIDMADIVAIVWNMKYTGYRLPTAMEYLERTGKEIILINTNDLL